MLHKLLKTHFSKTRRVVYSLQDGSIERYLEEELSPDRANLRVRIRFANNYLLELSEAIRVEADHLVFISYRYHFQDQDNHLIFRYDAAPHFPALHSFPHHKHLPDKVIAVEKPSVIDVIQEALGIVA